MKVLKFFRNVFWISLLGVVLFVSNVHASPAITSPSTGATLTASSVTLEWNAGGSNVSKWWVYAGSAIGRRDYADSGSISAGASSYNLQNLPVDSSTIYIRFWYLESGSGWAFIDYSYTAYSSTSLPLITNIASGSVLEGSQQEFVWSASGLNVVDWWFYVGSSVGGKQLFDSGRLTPASNTQITVNGLPQDGSTLYVRLWYRSNGTSWLYVDTTYQAANDLNPPQLLSPAAGATLSSTTTQSLTWTANTTSVQYWWIYAGSTVGGLQHYNSGQIAGEVTTINATSIPTDGSTVHIRLWYKQNQTSSWEFIDYSFTAHLSVPNNLSNYDLVFNDEFNGTSVNVNKWNSGYLWGPYLSINNEEQLYVDKLGMHQNHSYNPFELTGTTLKIKAEPVSAMHAAPESPPENDPVWDNYLEYRYVSDYDPANVNYLSGLLTSYESFRFTHGYVEARVKFPPGRGLWPAFWLLNSYYVEDAPEIDIVEFLGQNTEEVYHTYHYFDTANNWAKISSPTYETSNDSATTQFHTYGVSWEAGQIIWYVDGVEQYRITSSDYTISKQSMYVLLNLAVGGSWPGSPDASTVFPAEYEIDYVRVYQKKSVAPITPAILQSDYQLMFSDEFNGSNLDASKWNTAYLWGPYLPINNEEQYYVDVHGSDSGSSYSPFSVSGGKLTITAQLASVNPGTVPDSLPPINAPVWTNYPSYQRNTSYSPPEYTSGVITSYDKFKFTHGYAEARAKMPAGDGIWPAFWLLNGYYVGQQPEIDIVEIRGENPTEAVHSYHYTDTNGSTVSTSGSTNSNNPPLGYSDTFHTFAVLWEPGEIVWYIDGAPVHTVTDSTVSTQIMYVLANLAVGGNFNTVPVEPSAIPADMEIDYIRVYQRKDSMQ